MSVLEIKKLDLFKKTQQILKTDDEKFTLKTLCSLPLIVSVCADDKKITKEEFSYLKRYTRYFLNVDMDVSNKLARFFALSFRDDQSLHDHLSSFKNYIKEEFNSKEKLELLETLLVMARSDSDISDSEKKLVKNISKDIGVSETSFKEEIVNQSLILTQKMAKEIGNDDHLKTNQSEIDDMKIQSAAEYFREFYS